MDMMCPAASGVWLKKTHASMVTSAVGSCAGSFGNCAYRLWPSKLKACATLPAAKGESRPAVPDRV